MGLDTAEAPDETRTFFNTRTISRLRTDRLERVGPARNNLMDLQIIDQKAKSKKGTKNC